MNRDPRPNREGYEPPWWAVLAVLGVLFVVALRIRGGQVETPFDPQQPPNEVKTVLAILAMVAAVIALVLLVVYRRGGGDGGRGGGGWRGPGPDDDRPGPWDPPPEDHRPERAATAPLKPLREVIPFNTGDLFAQWADHPAPPEPTPLTQPVSHHTRDAGRRRGIYDGGTR